MPSFSPRSRRELDSCHPDLRRLFGEVIKHFDCTIVEGHREKERQDEAVRTGRSQILWPNGNHNPIPSRAVDAGPCIRGRIPWTDDRLFRSFGGFVLGVAAMMGIEIRWGGDWDGDWDFYDQRLIDLPHYELIDPRPPEDVLIA